MAISNIDQYLEHNKQYASGKAIHKPTYPGKQPINPARRVAVVACMDARLDVEDLLGLQTGGLFRIYSEGNFIKTGVDTR